MSLIQAQSHIVSVSGHWTEWLERLPHDIYHSQPYHQAAEHRGEGKACLFVYEEGTNLFVLPHLLKSLYGLSAVTNTNVYDVTSVYGYPGPLTNAGGNPAFLSRAWTELFGVWQSTGVVSAFTRFNPLLNNNTLVSADQSHHLLRSPGRTVSIDLTPSSDQQVRGYRKTLRQQINAARRKGLATSYDSDWRRKEEFVKLYNRTMEQRQAAPGYFITNEWLVRFRQMLSRHAHLFSAEIDGQIAASLLCLEFQGVVHAHLAGISDRLMALSPLKLLLDDVREWAARRGNHTFHLGGGLGGREDSLFEFKRQFSSRFHPFYIGGWIIDRRKYEFLTKASIELQGHSPSNRDFFPAYRAPDCYAFAANTRLTNVGRH